MSPPQPLPSLPPSPDEEDISHAGVWPTDGEGPTAVRRGKAKTKSYSGGGLSAPSSPFAHSDEDASEGEGTDTSAAVEGYPPTNDEEAESRRVAENLRRWETAERERRKAARESGASAAGPSIVGDITRRASLLWPSRRSMAASTRGGGAHQVLGTVDDSVPLDELAAGAPSLSPSPEPGQNPFTTPAASTLSLNDTHASAIMTETASAYPDDPSSTAPRRPALETASSEFSRQAPPPPEPINIPKPRTPPPPADSPHTNRPPEPTPPPVPASSPPEPEIEPAETRWWTDWLCGCKEDGDNQAGRTNPFE